MVTLFETFLYEKDYLMLLLPATFIFCQKKKLEKQSEDNLKSIFNGNFKAQPLYLNTSSVQKLVQENICKKLGYTLMWTAMNITLQDQSSE